jgi:mono/diheme cytochrome c family protein
MSWKHALGSLLMLSALAAPASARTSGDKPASSASSATVVQPARSEDDLRVEGEKRFSANCGRCHQSPHKFPPRMMLTIERHMRVRALITDEDLRLIVHYMTQ